MVRVFFDKLCKLIGRTTICQRTTGIEIRNQYFLVRTKYFGCLTHKVNATHHNDVSIRFGCPLSQSKAIAYKIGDILDFTRLIVMAKDNGILFLTQSVYLSFQIKGFVYRFGDIPIFQPFFFLHYIYIFSSFFKKEIYTDDDCLLILLVKRNASILLDKLFDEEFLI